MKTGKILSLAREYFLMHTIVVSDLVYKEILSRRKFGESIPKTLERILIDPRVLEIEAWKKEPRYRLDEV